MANISGFTNRSNVDAYDSVDRNGFAYNANVFMRYAALLGIPPVPMNWHVVWYMAERYGYKSPEHEAELKLTCRTLHDQRHAAADRICALATHGRDHLDDEALELLQGLLERCGRAKTSQHLVDLLCLVELIDRAAHKDTIH
jgi:hypothetical protein